MFPLMARILMATDVPPWPAVKAAFLDVRDVVGDEVVTQAVAFVDGAPELSGFGLNGQAASGVADSVGVDAHGGAVGIELEDVGAIFLAGSRVGIVDVGR